MSYCNQNVGINFHLGFGPQPGNVIRNEVNNGTCIGACSGCNQNVIITQNVLSGQTDNQQAAEILTAFNTINSGGTANYKAGNQVVLQQGFHAQNGAIFRAYIEGCSPGAVNSAQINTGNIATSGSNVSSAILKNRLYSRKELSSEIRMSPNPVKDLLHVQLYDKALGELTIQVFNMTGTLVYVYKASMNTGKQHQLDLSSLKAGLYLVKIIDNKQTVFRRKIVKL